MLLKTWIDEEGLTAEDVARDLEIDISALYRYMRGTRIPRGPHMAAIFELTGGRVTPNDFYDLPRAALDAADAAA